MQCPKCHYEPTLAEMQRSPGDCLKCGINYEGHARFLAELADQRKQQTERVRLEPKISPVVRSVESSYPGATPVVVVDLKMSFGSMVIFMVKWALASIPALLILMALVGIVVAGYSAFTTYSMLREIRQPVTEFPRLANPADPVGVYSVISVVPSGAASEIVIRVQRSREFQFTRYHVVCYEGTIGVLGQGPTLEASENSGAESGYSNIRPGTGDFYIARRACADVPESVPILK